MAYQKIIPFAGTTGTYIRIGYHHWDGVAKEASCHFHLYSSAASAAAAPEVPLRGRMATLRLRGAMFDQYLSTPALAAIDSDDPVRTALYQAAKAEPGCVISDWGGNIFADATDV
jgi:hypothetical protein